MYGVRRGPQLRHKSGSHASGDMPSVEHDLRPTRDRKGQSLAASRAVGRHGWPGEPSGVLYSLTLSEKSEL